jgi:ATP:ADP antiporter, AAA family
MLSQPYLLAIFLVISLYEIIVTIFDFQLKTMADASVEGAGGLSAYLGWYGVWTNAISLACIVLGINSIGRKLGLSAALVFTPILVGFGVVALWMSPTLQVAFWIMVISKAINYALNQPSKEQLYIPTTKDTKYKAKAWTEMFGSPKAGGSLINLVQKFVTPELFITVSSLVSFGLIGGWVFCALYLGKTHKKAVSENKVVC